MSSVRPWAVAGAFYPANPGELPDEVDRLLGGVPLDGGQDLPRALIAPHAGYAYSGPVAASAFRRLAGATGRRLTRVVVIGPSHQVAFRASLYRAMSVPSARRLPRCRSTARR